MKEMKFLETILDEMIDVSKPQKKFFIIFDSTNLLLRKLNLDSDQLHKRCNFLMKD